jgi:beta-glucosidase-like glycosyl hydrolase/CubicO group peptidase (beta-lactamase class C family)
MNIKVLKDYTQHTNKEKPEAVLLARKKKRMKKLTIYLVAFLLVSGLFGARMVFNHQSTPPPSGKIDTDTLPPFLNTQADKWVDSVFNTLTPDERIGQLFMVAAYSKTTTPSADIESLIKNQKIGGLIFMQGGPGRQAILNNHYQNLSKVPLMIGIDGEWGLSMRLDSTNKYPWQMTLGAIRDNQLIYNMGKEIGKECKRMGIHVNFAPVVDINNNIKNPVIGARSFGDNKYNVAEKGIAYCLGMQEVGVLGNAKHFPGHGDTDKDSHKSLPSILHDKARLDSVELYPFKRLIAAGLGSMMVAHLFVPAYDPTPNTATTLSPAVVTDLLQNQLGFKGLIFTDALGMKGVASFNEPGMIDMKALKAGNDMLLFSAEVPEGIKQIKAAISRNEITQATIDEKCKKILRAKYWMGLNKNKLVSLKNLDADLHTLQADLVNRKLVESSLTLLNNKDSLIPLRRLDTLKIATLSIGDENKNMFQKRVDSYTSADHFNIVEDLDQSLIDQLLLKLKPYNMVLVSIHKSNGSPWKNYTITAQAKQIIEQLNTRKTVIVSVFTNPYSLLDFKEGLKCKGLILSYQNSDYAMDYTAQLIFGGIGAKGMLPVSLHYNYPYGFGLATTPCRLKYGPAEEVGMDSKQFYKIDEIVTKAIQDSVFPGCQILCARKGVVFYNKGFGSYMYDKKKPVDENSIFDVASITKTSTSLPAIMKMFDEGKIDLNKTFGDYLPELIGSDKAGTVLIDQLTHQAGLKPWIPFYTSTLNADFTIKPEFYDTAYSEAFPLKVADHLFAKKDMENYMFDENKNTPLNSSRKYKYSDLGFYFWLKIVEKMYGKRLDAFCQENFFSKLGCTTTMFNPLTKFPKDRIIPTEDDKIFRKQMIQGYVHDQGAAMTGGVAGHAGLFSTANDLAKLYQMYLNNGTYGGERYLQESTVKEFTRCQFCNNGNRRGIGWDKPDPSGDGGTACDCVSYLSFGHAGFTGCLVWVDPKTELLYIFFSNRIHPSAENTKLVTQGQRAMVQEVFYGSIMN